MFDYNPFTSLLEAADTDVPLYNMKGQMMYVQGKSKKSF